MPIEPNTKGLAIVKSNNNFEDTYNGIISILSANDKIKIIKEIDHQANAAKIGESLEKTKVVIFGNPFLGTPLMVKNQLTALDLPQKIMVYEEGDSVIVAYNHTGYLGNRHHLGSIPTLETIAGALKNITSKASNGDLSLNDTVGIQESTGIITITSSQGFDDTYHSLKGIIENNENLKLMADLDHAANANKVDISLRPTKLLIFGNPKMGTPLMKDARSTAIDLPQKMLVWQDESNQTNISYNDPQFLADRHQINLPEVIEKITGALNKISTKASGE